MTERIADELARSIAAGKERYALLGQQLGEGCGLEPSPGFVPRVTVGAFLNGMGRAAEAYRPTGGCLYCGI